jgi:hypothetical protein
MIIAIGITGIRVTNRGQWMPDKWSIKKQERLSKNIYAYCCKNTDQQGNTCSVVDITDEKVHDDTKRC